MAIAAGWYADPWAEAPLRWWDGTQWTGWTHLAEPVVHDGPSAPELADDSIRTRGGRLATLLGPADRIAVVDVETTGLFSADRVVEVAVVTLDRRGVVVDEFECLINPLRDPGPTWLHGLTASVLGNAPLFEDIALHLAALLDGAVVAAHNLRFDRRLLGYEFARSGIDIEWGDGLDTLRAVGGCKLGTACLDYGIPLHGAHCALNDARATAQLLLEVADSFEGCKPAVAYPLAGDVPRVLTRRGFRTVDTDRPYVFELARGIHSPADTAPYVALLDFAVADLKFDSEERRELAALAEDLGLSAHAQARAHREFLNGLIDAAVADGVVTDDEFDQLCRVAALLELDDAVVCSRTNPYRVNTRAIHLKAGMKVCFTGAASWLNGDPAERDDLVAHASRHGLEPVASVTKLNCGLLVAADTASMSGKVKSAQKFGVPIASLADFLRALETSATLTVTQLPIKKVALVCTICGYSWIADRRRSDPVCYDCQEKAKPPTGTNDGRNDANNSVRLARLERCRQAVDLQREGLSRKQIGERLGVSEEAVRSLLRDGKFYAHPEADRGRLELAQRAADARAQGMARALFGEQAGLSKGKAEECWKDADVLFGSSNEDREAIK